MKIGTFARKFNMNISTVRYYVNNGLLSPDRDGGQYVFGKECVSDMENLLKYKKYHFSLEEIQLLFFMEKASRFQDEIVLEVCSEILKNKKKELIKERDDLNRFIEEIETEIKNLPECTAKERPEEGVPFSFIPYLYCPVCQKPLKLDSASLSNGSIQKGELSCECGYAASVSEGIILCKEHDEESPLKAFDNIDSVIAMKNQLSAAYRKLVTKTYIWMYGRAAGQLNQSKQIMAGPFTFNFLLEYIEKMGQDNTFIIFDPSLRRISKIKRYLAFRDYHIVYIVGKPKDLPIKRGSIDLYIDDYSTSNSQFTYNTFSTEWIAPLLKQGGEAVGIFNTYQIAPKSIANFKKEHPSFEPGKMTLTGLKYYWSQGNVSMMEEKTIGMTPAGELHFAQNVMGEQVEIHGYHAIKGAGKNR